MNSHPYKVFALRAMIAVPYFEKALYEMPEGELTAESIKALADKVERVLQVKEIETFVGPAISRTSLAFSGPRRTTERPTLIHFFSRTKLIMVTPAPDRYTFAR